MLGRSWCSRRSNSSSSSNSAQQTDKNHQQQNNMRKRTRRKYRVQSKEDHALNDSSKNKPHRTKSDKHFTFTIKPADDLNTGKFFRKQIIPTKPIKLKTYTTTNTGKQTLFDSQLNNDKKKLITAHEQPKSEVKAPKCSQKQPSSVAKAPPPTAKKQNKRKLKQKKKNESSSEFPDYLSEETVEAGLANGDLVRGYLRINPKNCKDAYVTNEDTNLADYYLTTVGDRNRALDGDEVVLKIKPETDWKDGKQTVCVVYIKQMVHPRLAVGQLKPANDVAKVQYACFYPRDKRVPLMQIPAVSWPNCFKETPQLFNSSLFVAQLTDWPSPERAIGMILENLGVSGSLKVETTAILREFCLDPKPYTQEITRFLPKTQTIASHEFKNREDLRKECVFTIDPLTARDLDDALSVKQLENGHYEIGVHISDASYYLEDETILDEIVVKKATTIYLVDNVYHMLPLELCLHCSLLPGADKLSFSVFWEMNADGEIFETRFTRSVVNSCCQLAYEHAQTMIDDPTKSFGSGELPPIYNGFSGSDLSRSVNILRGIAANLREARVRNGALKIDQTKLLFRLDPATGEPLEFRVAVNIEAHRLIEEFMLLANISVATKINASFPDIAFLRCHEPPKNTMLVDLQKSLETCGIHIDVSSSGAINSSLNKYITSDFLGQCRGVVLNHLLAKTMTRARYFCAGLSKTDGYQHYALSVPIYTHFTSPIRRYADIMVHRLLAASLGYEEKPYWNADHVKLIAANCNAQKYNAKRAGDASNDLYLAKYIEDHQPFIREGVVVDVKERSFDVIVLQTGSIVRVHQNTMEQGVKWTVEPVKRCNDVDVDKKGENHIKKMFRLTLTFPKLKIHPQSILIIDMFALVKVHLRRKENTYKLECSLLRPDVAKTNKNQ